MSVDPSQKRTRKGSPVRATLDDTIDFSCLRSLGLTVRESEVMHWIIEGKRDREIAIILDLSHRTVSNHARHIFDKLNVETRTAAVRQCAEMWNSAVTTATASSHSQLVCSSNRMGIREK